MELKNNSMREDFLSKRCEAAFRMRASLNDSHTDIRPFISLMKEYAGYAIEYRESVLPYINKLQQLFYSKHLLPFIVDSTKDRHKIDELPFGDVRDFLNYVWLAYLRVEEDWYWDEELQQYISKNSYGRKIDDNSYYKWVKDLIGDDIKVATGSFDLKDPNLYINLVFPKDLEGLDDKTLLSMPDDFPIDPI